jgi:hypothetical protein
VKRWGSFAAAVLAVVVLVLAPTSARGTAPAVVDAGPSPKAQCGPGSRPETGLQGQVTAQDHSSGYADQPFTCNTQLLSHFGSSGGFKVERYTDAAGHDCAYFDSTLLFPIDVPGAIGAYVLDMSDPAHPVNTAMLVTPAMLTPHESLLVNAKRGLLAAVMGNPLAYPGIVDLYDISGDCRHPVLQSSTPTGILGHESGFAPDGNTFYAASLATGNLTAIDVSNPSLPVTLWTGPYSSHGLSLSDDGNRAYLAARTGTGPNGDKAGLIILDVSQVQARVANPQPTVVSTLTWDNVSIPQNAMPISIGGHPYVLEIDEFAGGPFPSTAPSAPVGAGRIIDVADETNPHVISNLRLEVHQPEHRAAVLGDPGANSFVGGYAGHYCGVPQEIDPGIVACSMILSGLRVFDIRDPFHPKEIAYFNSAGLPETGDGTVDAFAMSRPSFVPERGEIWYADGNSGFYAVRLTNGVWPFTSTPATPSAPPTSVVAAPAPSPTVARPAGSVLPVTGATVPLGMVVAIAALALLIRRASAQT